MIGAQALQKTATGWVVDLPSEFARELGVAEGSAARLQARNGQIEAAILPPAGPALREVAEIFPGIQKHPGVMGGAACIRRTRISVWLLEEARRLGASEAVLLDAYPGLTAQDLVNAWAYVDANRAEIEQEIAENEQDDDFEE